MAIPIKERDYSIDCRVYTPENPNSNFANIKGTIDIYVLSHFLGWFAKTLIFRNNILLWTSSILFEIMELSLAHILPNFHECWWDHLLLDLFGCNLLGILLGMWVIKYYNLWTHHWLFEPTEESNKLSYLKWIKYSFNWVSEHVNEHKWHFLASP